MPIIPLTRAGQEIARILPPADALEVLERVGNAISATMTAPRVWIGGRVGSFDERPQP